VAETILAKMAVQISANTAELNKKLSQASGSLQSFQKNVAGLASGMAAAFGVREIAAFTLEISRLAGEAKGVSEAFDRLPRSERLMKDLKAATGETVSELDLMKRTVQATNFGISLGALPKLLEFASIRAQQTGQSVDYLVDSIITGIGRKSPLILDNLGISAVALKEKMGGVAIATASVGQVADAVGKIAEDSLKNMGTMSDNASTQLQRLNAEWENFKVTLGTAANETGVLTKGLGVITDTLKSFSTESTSAAEKFTAFVTAVATGGTSLLLLNAETAKRTAEANAQDEKRIKIFQNFARGYNDITKAATDFKNIQYQNILQAQMEQARLEKYTPELKDEIETQKVRIKVFRDLIDVANQYLPSQEELAKSNEKQIVSLESLNEKLKELNAQFESTDTTDKKKLANIGSEILATKDLIATLEELRQKQEQLQTNFAKEQLANAKAGKETVIEEPKALAKPTGEGFLKETLPGFEGFSAAGDTKDLSGYEMERVQIQLTTEEYQRAFEIKRELDEEESARRVEMANAAAEYGAVIGESLGDAISGQKKFSDAMKQMTGQLIKMFLQRALAGIISSAATAGGPPPVAIALAAAGVAAISAMFSKLGASGGGGGGGGLSSGRTQSSVSRVSRLGQEGQQILLSGEFRIRGGDLVYAINQQDYKTGRTG
jgi:hypothetical protein